MRSSRSMVLLVAALLLCLGAANAARFNWDNFGDLNFLRPKSTYSSSDRAVADAERHHGDSEKWMDSRAFVAIKYRVPPSRHDQFIDEWHELEKDTRKEDGNVFYDLKKTVEDNLYFMVYGEWETFTDYMEHFHAGHTRDFLDYLEDKDITWEMYPLRNVTDVEQETRATRSKSVSAGDSDDANRRRKKHMAHVLFQYHVDPSMHNDFIDAWRDLASDTWKEEGNAVFSLRKVGTNNHHFFGYGTWDSYDDFMDHMQSKHVRRIKDFFFKNDIFYFIDPVYKIGEEKEEM